MMTTKTLALATMAAMALAGAAHAQEKKTVAYIAPSLDISYWQWVGYGVKQKAEELGMDYSNTRPRTRPPSRWTMRALP